MFFSTFERIVAWRYLRARRQEGFLSVMAGFSFLGIFLGVATLIIVMSVMNGFRHELLSRILGFNGHITVYGRLDKPFYPYASLKNQIEKLPGVESVTPLIERQVMITAGAAARGGMVHGMSQPDLKARHLIAKNIVSGNLDLHPYQAALGTKLAQRLGVTIGGEVTLISPEGNTTAIGILPRFQKFEIGAIFDMGMNEYDSTFIFIPLDTAQKFFRMGPSISGLEVFVKNPNQMGAQRQAIEKVAAKNGARIFDWQEANASFFGAIQVERNVMFLILALIIVIAAFNVISSLIMLVKDKTRDIAILRTMGATQGMIQRIFFLTGASIGVVGALAGAGVGVAFSYNIETIRHALESVTGTSVFQAEIYFLSKLPSRVDLWEVLLVLVMTLGLTFLATLYPSWRASRLNPVEALRYE